MLRCADASQKKDEGREPQIPQILSRLRACYRTQDCQYVLEITKDTKDTKDI